MFHKRCPLGLPYQNIRTNGSGHGDGECFPSFTRQNSASTLSRSPSRCVTRGSRTGLLPRTSTVAHLHDTHLAVWKNDRLARDRAELLIAKQAIRSTGARVHYIEGISPSLTTRAPCSWRASPPPLRAIYPSTRVFQPPVCIRCPWWQVIRRRSSSRCWRRSHPNPSLHSPPGDGDNIARRRLSGKWKAAASLLSL